MFEGALKLFGPPQSPNSSTQTEDKLRLLINAPTNSNCDEVRARTTGSLTTKLPRTFFKLCSRKQANTLSGYSGCSVTNNLLARVLLTMSGGILKTNSEFKNRESAGPRDRSRMLLESHHFNMELFGQC